MQREKWESREGTFPACSLIPAPLPGGDLMLLRTWSLLWHCLRLKGHGLGGWLGRGQLTLPAVRILLCAWCAVQNEIIAAQEGINKVWILAGCVRKQVEKRLKCEI